MISYFWHKKEGILWLAFGIRLLLIFYGFIQETYFSKDYTDIDYKVFTDAAVHVWNKESPYQRHTYRYSPLIALILTPNVWLFNSFGKVLFSGIDIAVAIIINKILEKTSDIQKDQINNVLKWGWLFNPLVINISTRGSADTMTALLIAAILYYLLEKKYIQAGLLYGLVVHLRVYPIVFFIPIYLQIEYERKSWRKLISWNKFLFIFASLFAFWGIFYYFFFIKYGMEFPVETQLYHFIRKDNRHNFSLYFYQIQLFYEKITRLQSSLTFFPQMLLIQVSGLKFYKALPFCLFLQSFFFVILNKVITVQYFIWFIFLTPLFFMDNELFKNKKKIAFWIILWFAVEILWNLEAFLLEGLGVNVFLEMWAICVLFFLINMLIVVAIIRNQNLREFTSRKLEDEKKIK